MSTLQRMAETTAMKIQNARENLERTHGALVHDRLLAAAEEDRTSGPYDRYLRPPSGLLTRNPAAWDYALRWRPKMGNIFAWGGEGLGKSSMCRFVLSAWCAAGWPVMDLAAERIEREFGAAFPDWRTAETSRQHLAMAKRCLILLIDDVTNVRWTPRGIDALRGIVNVRHEAGKPVFLTSQTNMLDLHKQISGIMEEVYSMSLLRRLKPYEEIAFRGESYRSELSGEMRCDVVPAGESPFGNAS